MAQRIVVIGGGAAGIGAAGAAKAVDAAADIRVYTEFEDVGYSQGGIPYVHGKEIPDFERLLLATKKAYAGQGIDIHYETRITCSSASHPTRRLSGRTARRARRARLLRVQHPGQIAAGRSLCGSYMIA